MQKAVNFFRGSTLLEISGPYPERFFNICAAHGVGFWDAERLDAHTLRLRVAHRDRRRCLDLGEKALCQVTVCRGMGVPAFLGRFRRRYGMLAGLALSILATLILSQFVLVIQITGNESVSDVSILSALKHAGLSVGSFGPALNHRSIANEVLLELDSLSFLSVNRYGVRVEVIVRESEAPPEVEVETAGADVVALRDGVVVSVEALRGQSLVEEGQAVLAGEILISGLVTHEDGSGAGTITAIQEVNAKGEVWAYTNRTLSAAIPLNVSAKAYTGRVRTGYSLNFFDFSLSFLQNTGISLGSYDKIRTEHSLSLSNWLTLPVSWTTITYTQYEVTALALDAISCENWLRSQLEQQLMEELGESGESLSRVWTVEELDGILTVTLEAACLEQIGAAVLWE